MKGHVTTLAERQRAVAHWIAASAPVPQLTLTDWSRSGLAMLPTGVQFAVVEMPGAGVRSAARTDNVRLLDRYLARGLNRGPVFCYDAHDAYFALVPADAARDWPLPEVRCLGLGQTAAVPRPGLTRDGGGRAFWAVPMSAPAMLCPARLVANLIRAGRRSGVTCG
ncbi:hypothetical protein AB0F92_40525 [Kitasatospora aureofaciens]|uniref:hypothetical protein n=1 Tax=Kitasatospora aureofaciens TaxID=1894 RepID=UPI00092759AB|nr:hypothetical protein CP971_05455 [Streptomyces viridifaciens]UKZ04817.1 hypothetical protein BOQ63_012320 [Streptomyces viridifaciens]